MDKREVLTEGRWIDTAILAVLTLRLLRSFKNTKAFRLGIIDKNGKKIKDPVTPNEKDAYTLLDKLIFKVQRLLGRVGIIALGAFVALMEDNGGVVTNKEVILERAEKEISFENFDKKHDGLFESNNIDPDEYYFWKFQQIQKKVVGDREILD